ncbi:hypothetical protein S40293_09453 [Stachybotrys chartarum IBT 40293]|nr:hypothetical protein S40293_09453 [Stachybotrys chartarum IBT 40293]
MAPIRPFKVIVAGGGVAGLTLANMFQQFGIDYILLESHNQIAPAVGASIGLMPNGLLILDQLGHYETIQSLAQSGCIKNSHFRSKDGKSFIHNENMLGKLEKRQWLLQMLYDQVQSKDRIQLNSRVNTIELHNDSVSVQTTDGKSFVGDILVGADGVHSTVRNEMHRLAAETEPSYFPAHEEDLVPCYYQCSFGIAKDVEQWPHGEQCITLGYGKSFLIVSGPEGRCYWFLFVKLPETKYGKDIPRYSMEDEAEFVKQYQDLHITEDLTFGQLFSRRLSSTLTPLHEVVYQKWYYKRVVTVGDAAHKPNPIGGQGGNGAMETCAALLNIIVNVKKNRNDSLDGLSGQEIESILRQMQQARMQRAKNIVSESRHIQSLFAYENPLLSKLLLEVVSPFQADDLMLDIVGEKCLGTMHIKHLPVPRRSRLLPFHFELPAIPWSPMIGSRVRLGFCALMGAILFATTKSWNGDFWSVESSAVFEATESRWLNDVPLNEFYQVTPITGSHTMARVQGVFLLSQLLSPLLIYTIEGYRTGSHGTLLSLPCLFMWGIGMQGIRRTAPFHAILSALQASETIAGRFVSVRVAQSLVLALIVGYMLPVVMGFLLMWDLETQQFWTTLHQFTPPLFSIAVSLLSRIRSRRYGSKQGPEHNEKDEDKDNAKGKDHRTTADVPALQSAYIFAAVFQGTAYLATLAYLINHPDFTMEDILFHQPQPHGSKLNISTISRVLDAFFKHEVSFLASVSFYSIYTIFGLRQKGYLVTRDAIMAMAAVVFGQIIIGPSATWAALWAWREDVISSLSIVM